MRGMNEYNTIDTGDTTGENTWVIADCLRALGYKSLAILLDEKNTGLIDDCIAIITDQAKRKGAHDVLERMHFAGLIYGFG